MQITDSVSENLNDSELESKNVQNFEKIGAYNERIVSAILFM